MSIEERAYRWVGALGNKGVIMDIYGRGEKLAELVESFAELERKVETDSKEQVNIALTGQDVAIKLDGTTTYFRRVLGITPSEVESMAVDARLRHNKVEN